MNGASATILREVARGRNIGDKEEESSSGSSENKNTIPLVATTPPSGFTDGELKPPSNGEKEIQEEEV